MSLWRRVVSAQGGSRALTRGLVLTLASVAVAAAVGSAQGGDGTYGSFLDTFEVEVVEVDVVVTDRDGRAVTGLGVADFELLVDGKPVEVRYFTPPVAAPVAVAPAEPAVEAPVAEVAAIAPEPDAAPPLTLVLYFDETAMMPGRRNETIRAVTKFVEEQVPAGTKLMLAVFDESLRLATPLTSDRGQVVAALGEASRASSHSVAAQANRRTLLRDVMSASTVPTPGAAANVAAVDPGRLAMMQAEADNLSAQIESAAKIEAERNRRAMGGLADLVSMMVGFEGRKAILLAGGGFEFSAGAGLGEIWQSRYQALGATGPQDVNEGSIDASDVRREYTRLLRAAQAARVMLFTIDAGERGDPFLDPSMGEARPLDTGAPDLNGAEAAASLASLASTTGGRAFRASSDLDATLTGLVDALTGTYTLGFDADAADDDAFHRVEVKVRGDKKLRVSHREGFRRRASVDRASDATLTAAAFGEADNPLGAKVEVGAQEPARKNQMLVPVKVQVPLRALALIPTGEQQTGNVVFHFALSGKDGLLQLEPRTLPISFPNAQLPTALRQVVAMTVQIPLPEGSEYRLAVGVYDTIGASRSTLVVPLTVAKR